MVKFVDYLKARVSAISVGFSYNAASYLVVVNACGRHGSYTVIPVWPRQMARLCKAVITIAIRLRYDYDPSTTYRARLLPFDAIRHQVSS